MQRVSYWKLFCLLIIINSLAFHSSAQIYSGGSGAGSTEYTILPTKLNQLPEALVLDNQIFSIAENPLNNSPVGQVKARGVNVHFEIIDGNPNNTFSINDTSGLISVNDSSEIDFEVVEVFNLKIQASDGSTTTQAVVSINILNVYEAPLFYDEIVSIDENTPADSLIVPLRAIAPDYLADSLTYAIEAGNVNGALKVSGQQLVVGNAEEIDYEKNKVFMLIMSVNDGTASSYATFTVNLNNLNDNPPEMQLQNMTIEENTEDFTTVDIFSATDADGDELVFRLKSSTVPGAFTVDFNRLKVFNQAVLDYETVQTINLVIVVSDGRHHVEVPVSVNLININDNSPKVKHQDLTIKEHSQGLLSKIVATDADNNPLTYSIAQGNTDGVFRMDSNALIVAKPELFDYERHQQYNLTIMVNDGKYSVPAKVSIQLINLNDNAPVFNDQNITIDENSPYNTLVNALSATDADNLRPIAFNIKEGNPQRAFMIHRNRLIVYNSKAIDYEKYHQFQLVLTASDGENTSDANFLIKLKNLNDNAPELIIPPTEMNENPNIGQEVLTFNGTDADSLGELSYSIKSATHKASFRIDGNRLLVIDPSTFDYELIDHTNLTVTVSDGELTTDVPFRIKLINLNDNPPTLDDQKLSIDEGQPNGKVITTFNAQDPDKQGNLVYSIISGDAAGSLEIKGNRLLVKEAQDFDYEKQTGFDLIVEVNDGRFTDKAKVYIQMNNLNDSPPVFSNQVVPAVENMPEGKFVASVTASDADNLGTISYQIIGGNSQMAFRLYGDSVLVNNPLAIDYEQYHEFNLKVRASDGRNYATATITINLSNLNDNPPELDLEPLSIDENPDNNQQVMILRGHDPDENPLAYRITGGKDQRAFRIEGDRLLITKNQVFDYEKQKDFDLIIETNDGKHKIESPLKLMLRNVNDNPPVVNPKVINKKIPENSAYNLQVAEITASDADNDRLTYRIVSGNENNAFRLVNNKLYVYNSRAIDYEKYELFDLRIEVSDGLNKQEVQINIELENLNDNYPELSLSPLLIDENLSKGTTITQLDGQDADQLQSLTYSIGRGNLNDAFYIEGNLLKVKTPEALDYENQQTFRLTITVSDGEKERSSPLLINIKNLNDNPPQLDLRPISINTTSLEKDQFITRLNATDADNDQLTYTLETSDDTKLFRIDNNLLLVDDPDAVDLTSREKLRVIIKISDGKHSIEAPLEIIINP